MLHSAGGKSLPPGRRSWKAWAIATWTWRFGGAQSKFGVEIVTSSQSAIPRDDHREGTAQYRHKKQTAGAGQFAEVQMKVSPTPAMPAICFSWDVFVARSAVLSRLLSKRHQVGDGKWCAGRLPDRGCAMLGADGKEHPVDSKPMRLRLRAARYQAVLSGSRTGAFGADHDHQDFHP